MKGIDPVIECVRGGLKRTAKNLYWRAYGHFLTHPQVPPCPRALLFVCKGNICRSPFAEAVARGRVPDGMRITCRSAGIIVGQPESCPPETLVAAERFGIDLSGHRSRRIDQKFVDGADMVFAMEAWQFARLRRNFPQQVKKMFLLPLFDKNPPVRSDAYRFLNIRDPYGRTIGDYNECFERIDACLEGLFSVIRDLGDRPPGEKTGMVEGAIRR